MSDGYPDAVPDEEPDPDFVVHNEGTIFLFTPMNAQTKEHLELNAELGAKWFGENLVVEHRYAADLAMALGRAGFRVA